MTALLELIARGGGGGSGGGSGSGGGGIIVLLGYLPTHFVGTFFRRKLYNPIGLTLTIILTLIYATAWFLVGGYGFLIGLAALLGGPGGYFNWFDKVSRKVRVKSKKALDIAASKDPAWSEEALTTRIQQVFYAFQNDWSTFQTENLKTYMTPMFAYHNQLMLVALGQRGRRNSVEDPKILEMYPIAVDDEGGADKDSVTFAITAKTRDVLIETVDNQPRELFVDNSPFTEYWHFVRSGNTWLLNNIEQATENALMGRPDVQAFAAANQFCYNLDWGWLLLPTRGVLFKGGKFGTSDINNHVIGVYKNLLVELYTFIQAPSDNSRDSNQYVIAQVALPKRYDSLIVEAKEGGLRGKLQRKPKGYNQLSLEWPDFNKRYNVYATNVEQVTVFELLHPVYMEKLFALPFKVSIEVVDNVIYLYTRDKKADYSLMYAILKDAFEEMKL